uniref:Spike protein n=2 Tax=Infectious bronchitis virus TaxID=11120 RepID=A4ZCP1_9GAMC|nr:spike protein [Infectious bronchitis virus]
MLVKLLSIVTVLSSLCSGNLFDENNKYVYYYQSGCRPPNGWHMHGGAYAVDTVFNETNNAVDSTCTAGAIVGSLNFSAAAVAMTAPVGAGMNWSTRQFCTAHCNFSDGSATITVFVTHCFKSGPNTCPLTGNIGQGSIRIGVLKNRVSDLNITVNSTVYTTFRSLHCVNNNTAVYLNGNLVYTSNQTMAINGAGVHFKAGGPITYKTMKEHKVLAYFQNGTAHDIVLCDDSPRGILACQYNTGNFSDGLYPFTNDIVVNKTFVVYEQNSITTTLKLTNFTISNQTDASPNAQESSPGVSQYVYYQHHSAVAGLHNFNFSFLSYFSYVDTDFNKGSYPRTCKFRPENINKNFRFNHLSVKIAYGPREGGCKQAVYGRKDVCCFMYSYNGPIECRGVYSGQLTQKFECVLLVFIEHTSGSRVLTSETIPVTTQNFTNNIVTGECVDYNIYGRYGRGFISDITEQASYNNYLADSGLAILDSSGAIDIFIVRGPNEFKYYKVNPCQDVNQQFVVSGGNVVGLLTSINESGSLQVEDLFFKNLINSTHRRKRSVSVNTVTTCPYVSYGKFCFKPDGEMVEIVPEGIETYSSPLFNLSENVLIPYTFNLTVTDEYIQTTMEKVQINCIQYVCGNSIECKKLFQQYGPVCDNILSIVNSLAQQDNMEFLQFYSATKPKGFDTPILNNVSTDAFNLSLVLRKPSNSRGRSFIEDLLFTKVESLGLPGDTAYQKCTAGPLGFVKDLVCAQHYNGLLVLPPIITAEMQTMYTASLVASMAFGGITSAGAIPFATQIQARINHLGITQTVLQKNQEQIAASFNKAMLHMQDGFRATSSALQQIQDVINKQGSVLQDAMNALNKNFGAVSSVIQDIYSRLDTIEANVQVNRLITGRLSSLSVLASAKQAEYAKVSQQRELAKQKINECVKSQSTRLGFCGAGKHVLTIPQNAPNGIVLLHFTYTPETYKNVTAVVGFCIKPDNGSEYAIVPVSGRGIFIQENDTYYITARDMYMPRAITGGDVVMLTSCQANYVSLNRTVITTFVENDDFNFDDELSKWWNRTKSELPDFDQFNYTIPVLNITYDIDKIEEVINGLNDSLIDLEVLSILKTYIKWPWYVWLAIAFLTIIFILILVWIFFMTGCCGCCCGCFGLIPLMSKCGKKSSYYTTFDDDVVGVQIKPKKNV